MRPVSSRSHDEWDGIIYIINCSSWRHRNERKPAWTLDRHLNSGNIFCYSLGVMKPYLVNYVKALWCLVEEKFAPLEFCHHLWWIGMRSNVAMCNFCQGEDWHTSPDVTKMVILSIFSIFLSMALCHNSMSSQLFGIHFDGSPRMVLNKTYVSCFDLTYFSDSFGNVTRNHHIFITTWVFERVSLVANTQHVVFFRVICSAFHTDRCGPHCVPVCG